MNIEYLSYNDVIKTHDIVIKKTGGLLGINNSGLIESIVEHIQNDIYYPTIIEKLTHLIFSLVMNHAFNDANKRTSIACGILFLNINGYDYIVDDFIVIMEDVVVSIAEGNINKDTLNQIIYNILKG